MTEKLTDQIYQFRDEKGRNWLSIADYLAWLAETTKVLEPLKPKEADLKDKKK